MQAIYTEVKASTERELFTGLTYVTPMCVNPTQTELATLLGVSADKVKSKEYITDKVNQEGVSYKSYTIDIWFKEGDGRFDKLTFWIDSLPFISKTGNREYLGVRGKNHFAPSPQAMEEWLNQESSLTTKTKDADGNEITRNLLNKETFGSSFREALAGERVLAYFLNAYLRPNYNQEPDYKCELDNSITTPAGIKELNQLFRDMNSLGNPKVGVVYGVKKGYSNVVINSWIESFFREGGKLTDVKKNAFIEEGVKKDFEFMNGFDYQVYIPAVAKKTDLSNLPF